MGGRDAGALPRTVELPPVVVGERSSGRWRGWRLAGRAARPRGTCHRRRLRSRPSPPVREPDSREIAWR
jgi:hypothetical protein